MHSCAEAGWKRKRSWKYEKLFHNFHQIVREKEENSEKKVGNMKSNFTISTRFLGKDLEKEKSSEKKLAL